MACTLPAVLYQAPSIVSLSLPNYLKSSDSRKGGALISDRVWRGRGRQCKPLVTALNAVTASTSSSSGPAEQQAPPIIELQFLSPESASVSQTFSAISGEENLRKFMLENRLELYSLYGKVMNCGGGGSCGTCIVEVLDGQELLNERTDAEYKYLRRKPGSWRLACQTIVGDKLNSGKDENHSVEKHRGIRCYW